MVLCLASFAYGKAGFDSWGCCVSWENIIAQAKLSFGRGGKEEAAKAFQQS